MKLQDPILLQTIFQHITGKAGLKNQQGEPQIHSLYFRNSPDGTLRWVWPSGLKKPLFLKTYNTCSGRAKWIAQLIRLIFACRLQRLFASGKYSVTLPAQWAKDWGINGQNWAIFTGTAGSNRTAVLYGNQQFYKIPIGHAATALVAHEHQALLQWQGKGLQHVDLPACAMQGPVLITADMGLGAQQPGLLGHVHWLGLSELANHAHKEQALYRLTAWHQVDEQLDVLGQSYDARIPQGMLTKLQLLKKALDEEDSVVTGLAHGDFTPWNCFVKDGRLALIDWEMAHDDQPLLFDAFHFMYQQAALVAHCSYSQLQTTIRQSLNHPLAQQLIEQHGISVRLHHRLYLLFTITYYLHRYAQQRQWHPQVAWSLRLWNEALNDTLLTMKLATARELLVLDLFGFLQSRNYTALKWAGGNPMALSAESDLDLCCTQSVSKQLTQYLKKHPLVKKYSQHNRSFMRNLMVVTSDGQPLSIDMLWRIKRKSLVMMEASALLHNSSVDKWGIKTPMPENDFTYTWLFYLLNGAAIPERYRQQYQFYSKPWQQYMQNSFAWLQCLPPQAYTDLFFYNKARHFMVVELLKQKPFNNGLRLWQNRWGYWMDTLLNHWPKKGMVITFSGVDGAGKSTVIAQVRQLIEKRYRRKVVVLRHRPALLPMLSAWKEGRQAAEAKAAERLPRQGTNQSFFSSLLRFGYYYTDYLLGQLWVQVKYVWQGYIVLYDRYYFDFIHDAKRSNIELPKQLTTMGYCLLIKPSYNFFLYADVPTILQRKQELDGPSIQLLTGQYLHLFKRLGQGGCRSQYIAIENKHLPHTLQVIHQHLQQQIT